MKRILAVVLILVCFPFASVFAQNHVTSMSVGSGEDAIASGITGVVRFGPSDSSRYGEFTFQKEQAWFVWGKAFHGRVNGFVAGSAGYLQGSPWVGPYILMSVPVATLAGQELSIGMYQWPIVFPFYSPTGWRAKRNPEALRVGYLGNVNVSWGPITFNESLLNFLHDPSNSLPGVAFNFPVTGLISGNLGYTRNVNGNKDMWYVGITTSMK